MSDREKQLSPEVEEMGKRIEEVHKILLTAIESDTFIQSLHPAMRGPVIFGALVEMACVLAMAAGRSLGDVERGFHGSWARLGALLPKRGKSH